MARVWAAGTILRYSSTGTTGHLRRAQNKSTSPGKATVTSAELMRRLGAHGGMLTRLRALVGAARSADL